MVYLDRLATSPHMPLADAARRALPVREDTSATLRATIRQGVRDLPVLASRDMKQRGQSRVRRVVKTDHLDALFDDEPARGRRKKRPYSTASLARMLLQAEYGF